jgi:phosphopentomutase
LEQGLLFVNLVDFDMKYGHRRDIIGYGQALAVFDAWLGQLLARLDDATLLVITADHGCDPGYTGTDHTREYVPLWFCGKMVDTQQDMDTRSSFADLAATLADYFHITYTGAGTSFAKEVFQ